MQEQSEERLLLDCHLAILFSRRPLLSNVRGELLWTGTVVWPEQFILLSDRSCLKKSTAAIPILQSTNPLISLYSVGKDQGGNGCHSNIFLAVQLHFNGSGEKLFVWHRLCPQEGKLLFRRLIKCISYKHSCLGNHNGFQCSSSASRFLLFRWVSLNNHCIGIKQGASWAGGMKKK